MSEQDESRGSMRYAWAACAGVLALAGCGREDFMPSAPGDFDPRTAEEDVLVLDHDAPDMNEYKRIGTALIKAKKDLNALKGCRAVAAEHGGDAILAPESKGAKEWKCTVLRHKDKFTSVN